MLCCFWRGAYLALAFSTLGGAIVDSFLGDTLVRQNQVQNVLEHESVRGEPLCQHSTVGPIETTLCDYETIESVNGELYNTLSELVRTPFFKYFQVDLYRECPYWQENGFCMNRECGITTVDESEIPERWRAAALSKIELPPLEERVPLPGCYYRDSDFCFLDDMTEGEYVDLTLVPERYTGYSGPSAHRVWKSIYEENCFGLSELNLLTGRSPAQITLPDTLTDVLREPIEGEDADGECLEKRVYYKIISGLHASISTHICMEYLNQTTGEMGPNLECFVTRVASHPERLQYIYFNTVLLLRAVSRIGPYLRDYDYCSLATSTPHDHILAKDQEEVKTHATLSKVIDIAEHVGRFDERVLFRGENANILKEEFKAHFRNVSRIMDCVGCDKCRLWGKVQTTGLATALKILFEMDETALDPHKNQNLLQRSEVVALINTLHRFSESLQFVESFRDMWKETGESDAKHLIREAEKAVIGNPRKFSSHESASHTQESTPTKPARSHPLAGSPSPTPYPVFLSTIQSHLRQLIRRCKRSTLSCFGIFSQVWQHLHNVMFPLRTEL
ncbi:endoplasmic oxidoreductin-1 [Rhizopogon vinicolor AM-OR11-026]|uniref:Endoplasmic oxidoreductin-1 n=1 Tax=Rhizopogon vinicolor AM-OR11-026 TaxID=1314800 RepID=A0A1B7N8B4_9AGAM|nr:endoplasmic oxidoreductin-1 [Rhizopogon vinicolor AM-OR11-026]